MNKTGQNRGKGEGCWQHRLLTVLTEKKPPKGPLPKTLLFVYKVAYLKKMNVFSSKQCCIALLQL